MRPHCCDACRCDGCITLRCARTARWAASTSVWKTSISAGWTRRAAGRPSSTSSPTITCPRCRGLAAGLGRVGCPTAIIWGDRDRYIPFSTARELAERIPGATLTQLTGGDHYIMEERPDEVTAALLELLARPCAVSPAAGIKRYPR